MSSPWLLSNSRKRTVSAPIPSYDALRSCPGYEQATFFLTLVSMQLQDRTQFSDDDLYTLKRYWDNGMTSLGSVCREKIAAAATKLSVDSEIIKVCRSPLNHFCMLKVHQILPHMRCVFLELFVKYGNALGMKDQSITEHRAHTFTCSFTPIGIVWTIKKAALVHHKLLKCIPYIKIQ